jgi:hypothetical protein
MAGINEPDLYELSCDGVVVTYSTSSFNGSARLSYRESYPDVNAFGPEIRVVATGLGSEVTVDVEAIPDLLVVGPRQTYRVIELSGTAKSVDFFAGSTPQRRRDLDQLNPAPSGAACQPTHFVTRPPTTTSCSGNC